MSDVKAFLSHITLDITSTEPYQAFARDFTPFVADISHITLEYNFELIDKFIQPNAATTNFEREHIASFCFVLTQILALSPAPQARFYQQQLCSFVYSQVGNLRDVAMAKNVI